MKKVLITYVLLTLSLVILIYTVISESFPLVYPDNSWGFAGQMPLPYWIGFLLFLFSFIFLFSSGESGPSQRLCLLWLVLLVGYWNVNVLVQPLPSRPDSFEHFAEVLRISEDGNLTNVRYGVGGWPGLFIFGYVFTSSTGLSSIDFLRVYPLVSSTAFILSVFLVAKRLFKSNMYGLGSAALALFGNTGVQYIFTPHSLVVALLPLLILVFWEKTRSFSIVYIVLFAGTVMIYGLYPIYFVAVLLSFASFIFLLRGKTYVPKMLVMFTVTLLLAYMSFMAEFGIERAAFTFLSLVSRPPTIETYAQEASSRLIWPGLALTRSGLFFFFLVMGTIITTYLIVRMIKRANSEYAFLASLSIWGILLYFLSPYLSHSLPGIRTWYLIVLSSSLLIPVLAMSIERAAKSTGFYAKGIVVVLVILLSVPGFVAVHAYDAYLVAPPSELSGTRFIAEHWNGSKVFDGRYPALPVVFYKPNGSFVHREFYALGNETSIDSDSIIVLKYTTYSYYFLNGRIDEYNILRRRLSDSSSINRIYDSSTLKAFVSSSVTP